MVLATERSLVYLLRYMEISEKTRRDILDALTVEKVIWYGRLGETVFLSRIYRLDDLPSTDRRYSGAESDIWMHREQFVDWPDDWVFTDSRFDLIGGPDNIFLRFLCEMVHPVVRSEAEEASSLVKLFNKYLKVDGWEIVETARISGSPVYAAQGVSDGSQHHLEVADEAIVAKLDSSYLSQQITRIRTAEKDDPELAIGTAKELVETVCKSILAERSVSIPSRIKFPQLVKQTVNELKLVPGDITKQPETKETVRVLLNNLATISNMLAELRNNHGSGHGKEPKPNKVGLEKRHAELAVGAATTLAVFLFKSHEESSGE